MRLIYWDDGTRYDDVNSRWGDPSYVLEPGDPGYVNHTLAAPPGGSPTQKRQKGTKTMNETPKNQKVLLALAKKMRAGAANLQDTIGLHHHRETTLDAAVLKLEGYPAAPAGSNANKGSQLVYKLCEDAARDSRSALKVLSDGTVHPLLVAYHSVMERIHGRKHNAGGGRRASPMASPWHASMTNAGACWWRCALTWWPTRPMRPACRSPAARRAGAGRDGRPG